MQMADETRPTGGASSLTMETTVARLCTGTSTGALPPPLDTPEVYSRNAATPWLTLYRDMIKRLLPNVRTWNMAETQLQLRSESEIARMASAEIRADITEKLRATTPWFGAQAVLDMYKDQMGGYLKEFVMMASEISKQRET